MTRNFVRSFVALVLLVVSNTGRADIVFFTPMGLAGTGFLGGNIVGGSTNPGSGGVGPTGIYLDTDTNILHVDIEWGSGNGYTDMTGPITMVHLHGMTADPAPASFSQVNMNILVNIGNSLNLDNSPTSGSLVDDYFIDTSDIPGMLQGRTYINIHTAANPGGEIRGYLVRQVPEPTSAALIGLGSFVLLGMRRRRQA